MTVILGLTGSVAMGKSTVASQCRFLGAAVFDADREVHRLLAHDRPIIAAVAARFPQAVCHGAVDRRALGRCVFDDDAAMNALEDILHPAVRHGERRAIRLARLRGVPWLVLDIPLLFETGADTLCDAVMVVTAPGFIQWQRLRRRVV